MKNLRAAEKASGTAVGPETEYLAYVAHNQGRGGLAQIVRSAKSGGRRKVSKTVLRNMKGQGRNVQKAIAKNPDNPAQGFLDYFKKKWLRVKPKGVAIASAAPMASGEEVA